MQNEDVKSTYPGSQQERGNTYKEYRMSKDYYNKSLKRNLLLVFVCSNALIVILSAWDFLKHPEQLNGVFVGSLFFAIFMLGSIFAAGYFIARRLGPNIFSFSYTVILSDDSIEVRIKSILIPNVKINRQDIGSIEETKQGLLIKAKQKRKGCLVPKNTENYDKIKEKIQEWLTLSQSN